MRTQDNITRRVLRSSAAPALEIREASSGGMPTIVGLAVPYNALSETLYEGGERFHERFIPGALTKSIQSDDQRALAFHNPELVLGRVSAGTLKLRDSKQGLWAEITPPDTQYARDLIVSIRRRDVSGFSFGFSNVKDRWIRSATIPIREVLEARLVEVSLVAFPAYQMTTAGVRGVAAAPSLKTLDMELQLAELEGK